MDPTRPDLVPYRVINASDHSWDTCYTLCVTLWLAGTRGDGLLIRRGGSFKWEGKVTINSLIRKIDFMVLIFELSDVEAWIEGCLNKIAGELLSK